MRQPDDPGVRNPPPKRSLWPMNLVGSFLAAALLVASLWLMGD